MPYNDVAMGLYNDALKVHDAKRVGGGLGTMGDSVNPNYTAAIDKQNEMERHTAAAGALENSVDNSLAANSAEMTGLYQTADQRNEYLAGLQSNAYQNAANRELQIRLKGRRPGFMETFGNSFATTLGHTLGGTGSSTPSGLGGG
jgi:hypothetical protein